MNYETKKEILDAVLRKVTKKVSPKISGAMSHDLDDVDIDVLINSVLGRQKGNKGGDYKTRDYKFKKFASQQGINFLLRQAELNPQKFLASLNKVGRTPETEDLLQNMFPGITPEDMNEIFNNARSSQNDVILTEYIDFQKVRVLSDIPLIPRLDYSKLEPLNRHIKDYSQSIRDKLKITRIVKLSEIKKLFLDLGWSITEEGDSSATYFALLKEDLAAEGYRISEISFVGVKGNNDTQNLEIFYLQSAVSYLWYLMRVHPAISLAAILCDLPEIPSLVSAVKDDSPSKSISINILKPVISPRVVSAVYAALREPNKPRFSKPAIRTYELIEFVDKNISILKWPDVFKKWNKEKTSKQYQTMNSMRTAYYKAKRKWKERGGKSNEG